MSSEEMEMIEALIALHAGTDRQGPGDTALSRAVLDRLPPLPAGAKVADLGCGSGAASLLLARQLKRPVLSVDLTAAFLEGLESRAAEQGLEGLITPLCADMGAMDPAEYQFGLIWSEGAAYNLSFEGALKAWRPLLEEEGIAVISEMSWFGAERPGEAAAFWSAAYPQMAEEAANLELARTNGFKPLFTERLSAQAWWDSYYTPLLENVAQYEASPSAAMQQVLAETRQEIELFRKYSDHYGYTFYVLLAG